MLPKLLRYKAQAILTILGMTQKGVFVPYRYASGLLADMPVPSSRPCSKLPNLGWLRFWLKLINILK